MWSTTVLLKDIAGAHAFVHLCDRTDGLVELLQDSFCIDGRSIIGTLSLDLTRPVRVEARCHSEEALAAFCREIAPFVCE